jgi:hypothetical protein
LVVKTTHATDELIAHYGYTILSAVARRYLAEAMAATLHFLSLGVTMQYLIEGADAKSGEDRTVIVSGENPDDTRQQAKAMNLLVSRVAPHNAPAPTISPDIATIVNMPRPRQPGRQSSFRAIWALRSRVLFSESDRSSVRASR